MDSAVQHDDIEAYKREELFAAEALLLGRVAYEMFAGAWPSITDEVGFADRMSGLPKHVVSSTATEPTWNVAFVRPASGSLADQIRQIRSDRAGDLLVGGSAMLARFLFANNLVDELRLLTYPVGRCWSSPVRPGDRREVLLGLDAQFPDWRGDDPHTNPA